MKRGGKRSSKKSSKKHQEQIMTAQILVLLREFIAKNSSLSQRKDEEAKVKFCNNYKEVNRNVQFMMKSIQDSLQPPHVDPSYVDVDPSYVEQKEADNSDAEEEKVGRLKEAAKETKSRILSYTSSNSSTANDENGDSGKTSARTDLPFVSRTTENLTNGEASTSGSYEDVVQINRSEVNSNRKRKRIADSSSLAPLLNKRMKTCSHALKCEYDPTVDTITNMTSICDSVNTLMYRLHNHAICNLGYVECPYCENEENNGINVRKGPHEENPSSHTHHPMLYDSQGEGGRLLKIDERMDELLVKMRKKNSCSIR